MSERNNDLGGIFQNEILREIGDSISTRRVFVAFGCADARPPTFVLAAFRAAAPRQLKSCEGVISSERVSTEMLAPGSIDAAIARSLNSSDQRRRSPTGAPSSRSARTSMNWFGLALRIGVDIEFANHGKILPPARLTPPERRLKGAYDPGMISSIAKSPGVTSPAPFSMSLANSRLAVNSLSSLTSKVVKSSANTKGQ